MSRKTATPQSDLDLLVQFAVGQKTFDNYMDLKLYLQDLFEGVEVDLVIETTLKPALRDEVLSSAHYVA